MCLNLCYLSVWLIKGNKITFIRKISFSLFFDLWNWDVLGECFSALAADLCWLLLAYGVLKCVHVVLAAVECSSGDVHTHGVDTHIVWGRRETHNMKTNMTRPDINSFKIVPKKIIKMTKVVSDFCYSHVINSCKPPHLYYEPHQTPLQTSWPALWTPDQLSWGPAGSDSCKPQCWRAGSMRK